MQDPASPPATSQQAAGHEIHTTFRAALLAPTDPSSNAPSSETRDRFFDNAKGLLILINEKNYDAKVAQTNLLAHPQKGDVVRRGARPAPRA